MKEFEIRLSSINDVKCFVNAAALCDYDIDLSGGRYLVDAKSIMGIFSLDLMHSLRLIVHSDECEDLKEKIGDFIVSEIK